MKSNRRIYGAAMFLLLFFSGVPLFCGQPAVQAVQSTDKSNAANSSQGNSDGTQSGPARPPRLNPKSVPPGRRPLSLRALHLALAQALIDSRCAHGSY